MGPGRGCARAVRQRGRDPPAGAAAAARHGGSPGGDRQTPMHEGGRLLPPRSAVDEDTGDIEDDWSYPEEGNETARAPP